MIAPSQPARDISIVVTGGASGIGLAITKVLATKWPNARTHISILDFNNVQGPQVVETLQSNQDSSIETSFSYHHCNVASWDSISGAFAEVVAQRRKIDIVLANAGVAEKGAFLRPSPGPKPQKPDTTSCDINLYGVLYTVNLAIHYMKTNDISPQTSLRGHIICTASNAGLYPFALEPMYATAKHGVVGLVRSLGLPLAQEKIQINGFAPCIVQTNIAPGVGQVPGIVLTPLESITKAVEMMLDDSGMTGQVLEVSEDRVTTTRPQEFVDVSTAENFAVLDRIAVGGAP